MRGEHHKTPRLIVGGAWGLAAAALCAALDSPGHDVLAPRSRAREAPEKPEVLRRRAEDRRERKRREAEQRERLLRERIAKGRDDRDDKYLHAAARRRRAFEREKQADAGTFFAAPPLPPQTHPGGEAPPSQPTITPERHSARNPGGR